jgi:hypothetical protein
MKTPKPVSRGSIPQLKPTSVKDDSDIYTCSKCQESFISKYILDEHRRKFHQKSVKRNGIDYTRAEDGEWHCQFPGCSFSSPNTRRFTKHVDKHGEL